MANTPNASRREPEPGAFDVRGWLSGVGHVPKDAIQYVTESERSGQRTVTYKCGGSTAKVRMASVAGAAAWELVAEFEGAVDRVLLPRATRFVWRAPRGTHA
ncbi:MAG TPA: hypothetical protein VH371_12875 [Candidatus Limnocylindrales bacterium]